ncbi:MAG TPA: GAF domain-containing sensor histidine kinase [Chloroflexia bacterium]|nr:GAF domain-containing sensor histidine kinase [Chloroflexia bacterium]
MAEKNSAEQAEQEQKVKKGSSASEKLKERNRELAILKAIAEELNRAIDVRSALENSLARVAELLGLKTGWVWLLDEANEEPYLAAARMLPPFLTAKPSRMRGKTCHCLTTFMAGDLTGAANVNVLECSRLSGEVDGTDGLRYHASIPIYAHDKPLGVMNVASSDWRRLEQEDLQLLYTIGYQIGIAVERARLFDQTLRLATTEERNRLAREIHDTIAQGMAAVVLNLESAEVLLEDPNPARQAKGREKLRKALNLTRANLEEARRSVLDLRAAPLEEMTLAEALTSLVDNFRQETGSEAQFELRENTPLDRRYPARVEAGIYRIAQEALTNIKKHARPTHVEVWFQAELHQGNESLRLCIEDDGQGFDLHQVEQQRAAMVNGQGPRQGHFGLIGMTERARLLDGSLEITSCPGHGTSIELVVPLT